MLAKNHRVLLECLNVEVVPNLPILLALEQPERWKIQLNNSSIDPGNINGWWVNSAIKTLYVDAKILHTGENILTFNGRFNRLTNLEIVYYSAAILRV